MRSLPFAALCAVLALLTAPATFAQGVDVDSISVEVHRATERARGVSAEALVDTRARLSQAQADVREARMRAEEAGQKELVLRLKALELDLIEALGALEGDGPPVAERESAVNEPAWEAPDTSSTRPSWWGRGHRHHSDTAAARSHSGATVDWRLKAPTRSAAVMVGEFPNRWPFAETALYRETPALRYNRVDGFVLGLARDPLQWDEPDQAKVYGQVGYAFGLDKWRYEIGVEARPFLSSDETYGLKLGASYRYNTVTNDLWKANWIENSLAFFFFRNDFFDYYGVEGWTFYAVQRLSPKLQVSAGFRTEDHSSLRQTSHWSLFGGDPVPYNPSVTQGRMKTFVAALEGGAVSDLNEFPRGWAFRADGETGDSPIGTFRSLTGDVRAYVPVSRFSYLALRLRGGTAGGDVPLQNRFSIGGIGTVRGYEQNYIGGTSIALANAEYAIGNASPFDDVFEDAQIFGFFDAGRVGGSRFGSADEWLTSAGLGISLDERNLRFELAFPLQDSPFGNGPTLWFRLSPTF